MSVINPDRKHATKFDAFKVTEGGPAVPPAEPPSVSSVLPVKGPNTGGTRITVRGRNFKAGARVAGEGYGPSLEPDLVSLRYLKDLPLNALKLDQSFVGALPDGGHNEAISKTIITLAHNLGLRVIAEGVETAQQLESLRGLGCDEVQGNLFSKPLPPGDLVRILNEQAR